MASTSGVLLRAEVMSDLAGSLMKKRAALGGAIAMPPKSPDRKLK